MSQKSRGEKNVRARRNIKGVKAGLQIKVMRV